MNYLLAVLLFSTIANVVATSLTLKRLSILKKIIEERQESQLPLPDEQDIHNMLNNRLLELQNRKYALQRGMRKR